MNVSSALFVNIILLSLLHFAVIPPFVAVIEIASAPVPSALFRETVESAPVLAVSYTHLTLPTTPYV